MLKTCGNVPILLLMCPLLSLRKQYHIEAHSGIQKPVLAYVAILFLHLQATRGIYGKPLTNFCIKNLHHPYRPPLQV